MINVTPSSQLPISVERQQQIIDTINKNLAKKPNQGFCFMGPPGTGKTYLMKEIRKSAESDLPPEPFRRFVPPLCTLALWQEDNVKRATGGESFSTSSRISAEEIIRVAANNVTKSHRVPDLKGRVVPFESLHLFIDEFDSQPTASAFSSSKLQTFMNACYENASRSRQGNDQECVQLVIAMNKSWEDFEKTYGVHIARRIAEMCVRIDFSKGTAQQPTPELPAVMVRDDGIDELFADF
jgi:hypothetical protein